MTVNTKYNGGAWEGIDLDRAVSDPNYAIYDRDDFLHDNTAVATEYTQSVSDGGTNALTTTVGGIFNLVTGTGATHEAEVQRLGAPLMITIDSGLAVGVEFKAEVVTLTDLGVFIGLAEPGVAAGDFQTDTTMVLADKDYVGFHILAATPTEIDCVYKLAGATAVEVLGNAATSDAAYHTYGLNFDGIRSLRYSVDGAIVAKATLAAANFPSGQVLAPVFAIKSGVGGGAKQMLVDWLMSVQTR